MATSHDHNESEINVETTSDQHAESGDVTNEPILPHMEQLDEEVSTLDTRVDDLTADLMRVQADFSNFRRRAEEEKGQLMNFATGRLVREFLTVRDNFDRESANRPADVAGSAWAGSIDSIARQFDVVLKNLGVEKFESVGHEFDPHRHEAVAMEEGDGKHEVVIEEMQAGYQLGDQVLRHAIVKVGKSDKPKK
jgi:molecular chaperone GrpE